MAKPRTIGNMIAPWRFLLFFALLAAGVDRRDLFAGLSKAACSPGSMSPRSVSSFRASRCSARERRRCGELAAQNDANRVVLLVVTFALSLVILAAIVAELSPSAKH